ncbi:MAG: GspE/PulE family protein [Puniceicoccales bacterium]|jgi:type IV pilus assembly protein PilB|nr:GspE/PulE family protein [Puniceicoccales bacterium]
MVDNIIFQEDSPIARFIDKTLGEAVALHASDIHFETFDGKFVIRYRIDGDLIPLENCMEEIAKPVFSRLKVLANLNISETRLPQDGSISRLINGNEIEFRISCLPTQYGESVVVRILNNCADIFSLDNLMRNYDELRNFLKNITHQSGLTLFVGPTGCGKSTTLYGVLREIKSDEIKILTCEEPVEQRIDGISQSNINVTIGFSFSCALRAFLRHDPDVIFVGEIRDRETAELAIRAAITGHCVLATLHANDAIGAIPRLLDLGIDKTLIAEALRCVVCQWLEKLDPSPDQPPFSPMNFKRFAKFDALFIDGTMQDAIKLNKPIIPIRNA